MLELERVRSLDKSIEELFSFKGIQEAETLQRILSERVILEDRFSSLGLIGGADTSFSKNGKALSVIVVMRCPSMEIVEVSYYSAVESFTYIPGFLSFREGPIIMRAWERLKNKPDLLLVDGQGYAHPRNLGIASHLGVALDIPTIGCAKSLLVGNFKEPDSSKGSMSPIFYKGKKIGVALRTRDNVKPVFVSPGHKVSFETSVEVVMNSTTKYRLPEPLRYAHQYSKSILKGENL